MRTRNSFPFFTRGLPPTVRHLALVGPALVVLLLGWLVYDGHRRERESGLRVRHAYTALLELHDLRASLGEVEAGARGYLVAGGEAFLEPYLAAREEIATGVARLRLLLPPEEPWARLVELERALEARLAHADSMVAARQGEAPPAEAMTAALREGRERGHAARSRIDRLEALQTAALEGLAENRERHARAAILIVTVGTVLTGLLVLALNGILTGYTRRLETGARELAEKNQQLEEQAVELEIQASELEEQAAELEIQAAELESHNAELETASAALRAHHAYLAAVIDTDPSAIVVKDAEGRIQLANRATAELLGLAPEAVVGRMDAELSLAAEDVARFREEDRVVLESRREHLVREQSIVVPSTGERRWFEKRKAPLVPPDGGPPQVLAVALDVTERLRAEEAVRRSDSLIRRAQQEILLRLAQAAEFRDDETGRHTRRVGFLSAEIARLLGHPEPAVELIRRAAPLHDVGKIGIPDAILLKPGRLTPEEFDLMKSHTVIGGKMLAGGSSDLMVAAEQIAVAHHERWDGTGYPYALHDDEIPTPARIVAVADVVDALSHDRVYRPAWSLDAVRKELVAQRGRMFDPLAIDACLELLESAEAREGWLRA